MTSHIGDELQEETKCNLDASVVNEDYFGPQQQITEREIEQYHSYIIAQAQN